MSPTPLAISVFAGCERYARRALFRPGRAFGRWLRREWFSPQVSAGRSFTPTLRLRGPWDFLLLSTHELPVLLATPNRSGLQPFVSGLACLLLHLSVSQCL